MHCVVVYGELLCVFSWFYALSSILNFATIPLIIALIFIVGKRKRHERNNLDTKRLDFLQSLTTGYGNGWLVRFSEEDRGMRIHETKAFGATPKLRDAIDIFREER